MRDSSPLPGGGGPARGLALAAVLAAVTACSARPVGTAPSAGRILIGPGPRATYTVQAQPAAGGCRYRHEGGQPLPDPACTPGAANPDVTAATLAVTICRAGYSGGIRPPVSVTGPEKRAGAAAYDYTGPLHDAEYDHLISLELGGDPNDPRNLWVEPPSPGHRAGAGPYNPKDTVENHLHAAVCHGMVTLEAAQRAIATDWTVAEAAVGIDRPTPVSLPLVHRDAIRGRRTSGYAVQ